MKLILYGTQGCHLCEDAANIISESITSFPKEIDIECIDIAEKEVLQEKYAIRIPVLFFPESALELDWPFDKQNVLEFISALATDNQNVRLAK